MTLAAAHRSLLPGLLVALSGCALAKGAIGIKEATPIPGEGITNAVHAQNVGKIVFSKALIDRKNPDPGQLTSQFLESDRIYGRFYMPTAIANHFAVWSDGNGSTYLASGYEVRMFVDGTPTRAWADGADLSSERAADSTRLIFLNPEEDQDPSMREVTLKAAADWARLLRTLSPGKHLVRLELFTTAGSFKSDTPGAVGELTLERTAGPIKSGFSFAKITEGMRNPALLRKALETLQRHAAESGWKEKFERAKIESRAWGIERNEQSGVVLRRTLVVAGFARWPDGHCTTQSFGISQEHDGQSFASNVEFEGVGEQQEVDCED